MVHHLENIRLVPTKIAGMDTVRLEFGKSRTSPEHEAIDIAHDEMIHLIRPHRKPIREEPPDNATMYDDSRTAFQALELLTRLSDAREKIVEALPSLRGRPHRPHAAPRERASRAR